MFDHELDFTDDMLDNLIEKWRLLLEENKQPLLQVLRYWDEWRFVPEEIQDEVKHQIKNLHLLSPLEHIQIDQKTTSWKEYGSHWQITYKDKTYEDLRWSGNTYNHTISQQRQIEQRTLYDVEAWLLTEKERKMILALNYIHDIVEKYKGDTVQNKKTEEQRNEEWNMTLKIIEEQNRTEKEKLFMKYFFSKDHKKSLFKLYERMMYIIDMYHLMEHEKKYNETQSLVWYLLSSQIPRFLESFELIDGRIVPAYKILSCKNLFKEHFDTINNAFKFSENKIQNHHSYPWYLEAQRIWNEILLPKIY